MRVLAYVPLAIVVVLAVGLGLLPAPIGTLVILALLIVTGLAWRIVKLLAGGIMVFLSQV